MGQSGYLLGVLLAVLLCSTTPANGQFNNVLSALFGGGSTSTTPATTSAATSTTSSATPSATTAAATQAAAPQAAATAVAAAPTSAMRVTTAAAAAPAAASASPAAAPAVSKTPVATKAAAKTLPSPPPPAPIVIDPSKLVPALPADETVSAPAPAPPTGAGNSSSSSQTAVDMVLQISGTGVTPFSIPQQTALLRAMASVLTTVSLADLRIRYVTSLANSGRRLLADDDLLSQAGRVLLQNNTAQAAAAAKGELYNVATVTLEANCTDSNAVPATLLEMQSVVGTNLLASALQTYGESTWGVSLLTLTAVDPNVALDNAQKCKKKMGTFCLDNSSLTVPEAEIIIAVGCFIILMLIAIPCVWLEWRRNSGQMAELDPTPDTPKTPLDKVQLFYNNLVSKAKAASPLHRRQGSNGRNAFKSDTPTSARGALEMSATS